MKAISLWQPWASLIAVGAKPFETRHWPPPSALLGRRIAIHAAKRKTVDDFDDAIWSALNKAFGCDAVDLIQADELPRGAIVCTAELLAVCRCGEPMDVPNIIHVDKKSIARAIPSLMPNKIKTDPFGDYSPRRWAWLLGNIEVLDPPVPAVGRQGFFDWEPPR